MEASGAVRKRYMYEYMFFDAIEKYNLSAHAHGNRLISTAEARKLRIELSRALAGRAGGVESVCTAINTVLNPVIGADIYNNPGEEDPRFISQRDTFDGYMSGNLGNDGQAFVPISPFHPAHPTDPARPGFSGREAALLGGCSLMFVSQDDFNDLADVEKLSATHHNIPIYRGYRRDDGSLYNIHETSERLQTMSDVIGLSRLSKYMSEKEFSNVARWATSIWEPNALTTEAGVIASQLDKACAILDALDEEGIEYEIKRDLNPGQIKAQIKDTNIAVRLTETPENAAYIGRVYDNGAAIMYQTTVLRERKPVPFENATPEQCADLVRYAMGLPLKGWGKDGEHVGEQGTFQLSLYDKKTRKVYTPDYQKAYFTGDAFNAVVGDLPEDMPNARYGHKVMVHTDMSGRRKSHEPVYSEAAAEKYLRKSVESARVNLESMLEVDRLLAEAAEHSEDETYYPQFSSDMSVASVQQQYWELLTGRITHLLRPGRTTDEYLDALSEVGEISLDTVVDLGVYEQRMGELAFSGSPEEQIRAHAAAYVNETIGTFDVAPDGMTFNFVGVATYQDSSAGIIYNRESLTHAMRLYGFDAHTLRGSEASVARKVSDLATFNEVTATKMVDSDNLFIKGMHEEIVVALNHNGCEVDPASILIDDAGIVRYTATRTSRFAVTRSQYHTFTGEIGQIFAPDERGIVTTQFAGGDNYKCVPGYEARILTPSLDEDSTVFERTRLKGYEQMMRERIRYQVRQDVLTAPIKSSVAGVATSMNSVYRRLFDKRFELDFEERFLEAGMEQEYIDALVRTEASRVRYGNDVRQGSTVFAVTRTQSMEAASNDNFDNMLVRTGGKNMSILDEDADGYFDPVATAGGINQGITRYLVHDAKVYPNGMIVPGKKDSHCAILETELGDYMEFNPFDRQQMTFNNLMQMQSVSRPVGVAQMSFGGWTFDDSVVVSKKFAEEHGIRDEAGVLRSLVIGDKVSDMNGNKGVISLVIDPDMSDEEAERRQILKEVQWFRENPGLDVVMAPFPAVSRYNGGSARELMEDVEDLVEPESEDVHEGCIGHARMIITDKSADAKTHVYDDGDVLAGRGRRASAQLAWALDAHDCPAILREIYGPNSGALQNVREALMFCGLDMDERGNLRDHYIPHDGETRQVMELPEMPYDKKGSPRVVSARDRFMNEINDAGGFLEIPFPLEYKALGDNHTLLESGTGGYLFPILSASMRSGMELMDGEFVAHDFTRQIGNVFRDAMVYREKLNNGVDPDASEMQELVRHAQLEFDSMQNEVASRWFEGKHNAFRDKLMSRRMPTSATAIWTGDPRLDLDELGVGRALADSLGVEDGDYILLWRDPILRGAGLSYMRISVNDELTGVAINPAMDKPFDGDFDGDTVGLLCLKTEAAKREAYEKLSVGANLVDRGAPQDENGNYPLCAHDSLDLKVSQYVHPDYVDMFGSLVGVTNQFDAYRKATFTDDFRGQVRRDAMERSHAIEHELLSDLSKYYKDCLADSCGHGIISFNDMESHMRSLVDACIVTGAKGNYNKLKDYAHYLGVDYKMGYSVENGQRVDDIDYVSIKDFGKTQATREDAKGVEYATAVKSFGTGVAGAFSQRGVKALRNECAREVLELTYPVTQAILQAKHDPVDAAHRFAMLTGPVKELWRGHKMEQREFDGESRWVVCKDENGQPERASVDEWISAFEQMYTGEGGLGVDINMDNVRVVAEAMSQDGWMQDVEEVAQNKGSVMDRMAYGGTFETLCEAAEAGEDLFAGKFNEMFAPSVIRKNRFAAEVAMEDESLMTGVDYAPIQKSDTKVKERKFDYSKHPALRKYEEMFAQMHASADEQVVLAE